jgi:hypothetical protein
MRAVSESTTWRSASLRRCEENFLLCYLHIDVVDGLREKCLAFRMKLQDNADRLSIGLQGIDLTGLASDYSNFGQSRGYFS